MALTQTIGERTYTYSHCVGSLFAFTAPTDLVLGAKGVVYAPSRGADPGYPLGGRQRWTKWDLEEDVKIVDASDQGSNDGELLWPTALALGPDGNVYVTDEYLNRVSIFSDDGAYLRKWGTPGSGEGQLDGPTGMRFDGEGNVYIAESRNNRVQKFTADGKFLSTWGKEGSGPGEFNMPYGIHIDCHGDVFVADWGNDRIQKFSPDGELLAQFGSSGSGTGELQRPTGLATDKDGDVYVADWGNNRVQVFDADGEIITSFYGDARELSKSATTFISANSDFVKARKRADTSLEWAFRRPAAVAVNEDNQILIIESISGRIQIYQKEEDYLDPQFNL